MVTGLGPRLQHLVLAIPICCLLCSVSVAQQSQPGASQTPSQGAPAESHSLELNSSATLRRQKSDNHESGGCRTEQPFGWTLDYVELSPSASASQALNYRCYFRTSSRQRGRGQTGLGGKRARKYLHSQVGSQQVPQCLQSLLVR